jgi:hypothetical protein
MVARVVGVVAVVAGSVVGAQPVLPLTAYSGPAGDEITASQGVSAAECTTYTVFFDGAPVGSDDGSDGEGEVTFEVPAVDPGDYEVVAECSADEVEEVVGLAQFAVTGVPTSLTTTTGTPTSRPPTTDTGTTETTGGDGTTSTSNGTIAPPQNIEECEAQAAEAEGSLVYEPERDMVVGRTYEVTAALSLEGLPPVSFEGSTTVITLTDLRCTITAQLTGSDFAITAKSSESQSFIDTRVLDWRWDVRPLHSGDDLELTLRFQSIVLEGDRSVPGRNTLHDAIIDVDAEPRSFWSRLNDGIVGILTHPVIAPATAVAVAGLATWLGRKAQRRIAARRAAGASPAGTVGTVEPAPASGEPPAPGAGAAPPTPAPGQPAATGAPPPAAGEDQPPAAAEPAEPPASGEPSATDEPPPPAEPPSEPPDDRPSP